MNMNIQNIFLVISLIFMVIMYTKMLNMEKKSLENFNNNDIVEHMTDDMKNQMKEMIQQEYNYDLEAIRNLGAISKSLLTGKNYHSNDVSISSISYTENTGKLCDADVVSTVDSLESAKSNCDSRANCQGFTKVNDTTFEIHNAISGKTSRGAEPGTSSCYMKQQTEGTLENNNLIIPANVQTLGNQNVKGTLSVGGFELLPAGCIIMWGQEEIPPGWKKCDGDGTYTNADGETKEIPDLRGRFILGGGNVSNTNTNTADGGASALYPSGHSYETNKTGGVYKHTLNEREIPSHNHLFPGDDQLKDAGYRYTANFKYDATSRTGGGGKIYRTSDYGGSQAHNNMPPYYVLIYIIKVY